MLDPPLRCRQTSFDSSRTWVMGVVNTTPDSFSDGGLYSDAASAVAHGLALEAEGADLLDVGGESTRPGAPPVGAEEERRRVEPVIAGLALASRLPISIDTAKAAVARAALAAGATMVNDVTGGSDPALFEVVAQAGVPLVIGHLRGQPASMQEGIHFDELFEEVAAELALRVEQARAVGVGQIVVDPGIGFGKTVAHNLELLARCGELGQRLALPVMVGPSRKAFLGAITGRPVGERLFATLGAIVAASGAGADLVRVHDVRAAREALAVSDAVRRAVKRGTLPSRDQDPA